MKKLIIMGIILVLTACYSENNKPEVIIVKADTPILQLSYSSTIQPIKIYNVTSPVEGVIIKTNFIYGSHVKKDQLLLSIHSDIMDKQYQSALASYLTAKEKYFNNKNTINGTKELYQSGIISKNEYITTHAALNDTYLTFIQAKRALEKVFKTANIQSYDIERLDIDSTKVISQMLKKTMDEITVYAPTDGIALIPEKHDEMSKVKDEDIIGSVVKDNQVLVSIGDLTGIKLHLNVSEIDIDKLTIGEKAIITSDAVPELQLIGQVKYVSTQANSQAQELPTFPVTVEVNKINQNYRKWIHVGMNVKVTLQIEQKQTITLPLKAVMNRDGKVFVNVEDNHHHVIAVPVVTGITSIDHVAIKNGLKPGDKVVLNN